LQSIGASDAPSRFAAIASLTFKVKNIAAPAK